MRWVAGLIALFFATAGVAQTPIVEIELAEEQVVVGQPLVLTVKILVPTWMPKPPTYPNFEVPGLMVRLPQRSTTSISEMVEGTTWAGVQRRYRLYPLQTGAFVIPSQEVALTYADPQTQAPTAFAMPSPEVLFEAVIPDGARDLPAPVIARGFELVQELEGETDLGVGDTLVRRVNARIDGTTAVLIPTLMPPHEGEAIRAYSTDPVIAENEDRGTLSGERREKVTYLAQSEGTASLPPIRIEWFNLETGSVELAELAGVDLTIKGGVVASTGASGMGVLWHRWGTGLLLLALGFVLFWWQRHRILGLWVAQRQRWLNSRYRAQRGVQRALRQRDLPATYAALDVWTRRNGLQHLPAALDYALGQVGRHQYSKGAAGSGADRTKDWVNLRRQFAVARYAVSTRREIGHTGKKLNPF